LALGCGTGASYREETLRYERVIIMTDADVDGAHIASLLMTFFFREMAKLVDNGHLFLALPPLYRLTQGEVTHYARDDAHREELLETVFNGRGKVEISRFKGLGEMDWQELGETTMSPATRTLLQVTVDEAAIADEIFSTLMGDDVDARRGFIQTNAKDVRFLDI
jgi:topoisomerase IV subunit B